MFIANLTTRWVHILRPYLVFPFQHQQIGDFPKGQTEPDDLGLVYVAGQLAQVNDA